MQGTSLLVVVKNAFKGFRLNKSDLVSTSDGRIGDGSNIEAKVYGLFEECTLKATFVGFNHAVR